MDRGAWWATVHGVAKSRTRLSDFTHFTHIYLKNIDIIFMLMSQGFFFFVFDPNMGTRGLVSHLTTPQ